MKIQEMVKVYEIDYAGRPFRIEVGKMARQANGSCTVRYGDTVVLVTACRAPRPTAGLDFVPLTVNYMEMTYAAGKIPGGFFKREGRPSEREVLCSRLIDRPLRPLFPEGYFNETQVIATVLSLDPENNPEIAAMVGASTALMISDVPFNIPIAGVRVGRINGEFVCNPTNKQQKESDIDLIVAGSKDAIIMVEGGAKMVSEDELLDAMMFASKSMQGVIKLQKKMMEEIGKPKMKIPPINIDNALVSKVNDFADSKIKEALNVPAKQERYQRLQDISKELTEALKPKYEGREDEVTKLFEDLQYRILRESVLTTNTRIA